MKSSARALPGLCVVILLAAGGSVVAKPWWMRGAASNEGDFLPPDVAFRPSVRVDGGLLRVRWVIADGYYLYRHKFAVAAESPDLAVSAPVFPVGTTKTDPYSGTQEVYYHQVEATVAFSRFDGGAHPLQIKVSYQGCADAGLCYLPMTHVISPGQPGAAAAADASSTRWEGWAIGGGALSFLLAGLLLRKGRTLATPVS